MLWEVLEDAEDESYLGNASVVWPLVSRFVHNVLSLDASELIGECNRMADIFAGMSAAYTSNPDWTNRDGIGRSVAELYGIDPTQSTHDILRTAFATIATRVFGVVKAHHADDGNVWQPLIDRIVRDATAALVGDAEVEPDEAG
ncbi:hypothetical protein KDW82_06940 [Burkholderia vietnamiensis]|uniref:hypothetical protein n=1 Tax=Burkholderia vietnamiensis TaxID=60552 RepID=UPI001B9F0A14|nr:hypothetical protein [Burkholderia vietnamiensis]MBR8188795.1 hypothetical protein [Burkholderia vietnamiensis]